ncbi:MAG: choice-of-anchor U domain-containing protein [Comamonas sp.]
MRLHTVALATLMVTAPWSAMAQAVVFSENFDNASTDAPNGLGHQPPTGWVLRLENAETVPTSGRSKTAKLPWLGWKFVTTTYWNSQFSDGDRKLLTKASGKIAVTESDGLRPVAGQYFNAVMETPDFELKGGKRYTLAFSNHFKMGTTKREHIKVEALFSNGSTATLLDETAASRLNQTESLTFTAPADVLGAKLRFSYQDADNNWYWALDDVKVTERAPDAAWDTSKLPTGDAPSFLVSPTLQHPGTDRMSVMVETNEAEPSVWLRKKGSSTTFSRIPMATGSGAFSDASIRFADLQYLNSNTLYEYAVVTGTADAPKVSPLYAFKTWPKAGDAVDAAQFVVISDSQDGLESRFKTITEKGVMQYECDIANPATCADQLAGIIISGDLVGSGNSRSQWRDQFFGPMAALSPYVPLIPAPGNHEYFGEASEPGKATTTWAATYRKYFNRLPDNGSAKHPLHWYSLDYLGLRLISTDSNPSSAMHNTSNWNTAAYDKGRALFQEAYMQEQLDWFSASIQDAKAHNKSHVLLINHHPCLTTKWRQGEVLATCDMMGQLEDYARQGERITGIFNGHVHAYERGHSMDSRTLWLNVASASGGLEPNSMSDESDLDIFVNTQLDFGYGVMTLKFGDKPEATWLRRSIQNGGLQPTDQIDITTNGNNNQPLLPKSNLGAVEPAQLALHYQVADQAAVYEAQWQVSRSPDFSGTVFDVWGDATRQSSYSYINGVRKDTQAGVDISTLALGNMLANPRAVYPNTTIASNAKLKAAIIPGGNDLLERWQCDRKWDHEGDANPSAQKEGGRQCFARVTVNGEKASPHSPFYGMDSIPALSLAPNQTWYWRVRVRDAHLNWSDWSKRGRFQVAPMNPGQPDPEDEIPTKDIATQVPPPAGSDGEENSSGTLELRVSAPELCTLADAKRSPVPANAPADLAFPFGSLGFALQGCQVPGFSADIALQDASIPADAQLWKHHSATGKWSRVNASISAGQIRYTVTDGGELDEDGTVNGAIVDPVVIGVPRATPPVIPANAQSVPVWGALSWLASILSLMGAASLVMRRQRRS